MNVPRMLFRWLLGRRLPLTDGTLEVPGIRQPVLIHRDRYGIPYIEAQNDEDAYYALGFCQGQDRAFQIEIRCRAVRGTLAALIGPEMLPMDRLARRLGLYEVSARQLEVCDPETLQMLRVFTRGVTDGATRGSPRLAHEFVLLGANPTPYQAADALGTLKLLSIAMPSNWGAELARLKVLLEDGAEALKALDPTYPEWLPVTSPPAALAGPALNRLMEDLTLFMETIGPGAGSNNWVLDATRTATGYPLLANDPHLSADLPPHWYLAHVRTPEWTAAGACLVGTPAFTIGHNETSAWGVTAGLSDHADLFIEEIGPDGQSVRDCDAQGNERFVSCAVRQEMIEVKGGEPWTEEVLVTPRGPIISGALEGEIEASLEHTARESGRTSATYAISLSAVWLEPRPIGGFLQLHRIPPPPSRPHPRRLSKCHQREEQHAMQTRGRRSRPSAMSSRNGPLCPLTSFTLMESHLRTLGRATQGRRVPSDGNWWAMYPNAGGAGARCRCPCGTPTSDGRRSIIMRRTGVRRTPLRTPVNHVSPRPCPSRRCPI
jgi:penicillin G amidase